MCNKQKGDRARGHMKHHELVMPSTSAFLRAVNRQARARQSNVYDDHGKMIRLERKAERETRRPGATWPSISLAPIQRFPRIGMDTSAALLTPLAKKLKGKRVVLASASPRRSQILKDILVCSLPRALSACILIWRAGLRIGSCPIFI